MEIEEIIQKRPYLKETLLFYKKVKAFNDSITETYKNSLHEGQISYPPSIVEGVFERFSEVFDIPFENLQPLMEAMKLNQIDLTRLPHKEISGFLLPYHEEELMSLLFLLGRPFFLGMRRLLNLDDIFWQEGRCPVCSARPVLSSIIENGRRRLHCSFCGTTGFARRLGCPVCGDFQMTKEQIIIVEKEEGFRIEICDECGSYVKTSMKEFLPDLTIDLFDLITLPLDIIAQGRGYRRNSPNPLGMMRMG